jgi:catechol 2,3-dioxygenase-like lactoylglutathione lyase family enzyme
MSSCCAPTSTTSAAVATPPQAISTPKVHIHLHVPDLAESVAFYRAFFGVVPVKEHAGYAKFLPDWAPVNLALSAHAGAGGDPVVSHLGIQLPDAAAVRHHLARVQAAGLKARVEMGVDCCYANQDKFWVHDTAGIEWEVYYLNHDLVGGGLTSSAGSACCPR